MRDSLSPSAPRPNVERGGLARALRGLIMAAGTLLLAVAMVAPVAPAQAANPSAGFQPGNIISDANFYDGNAMSVAEVQAFLNKQVPSCWLGRPGYEVGKPVQWGGPTKLASKCLKDFRINTTTQTANAYCAAIPGIANETAASVIVRVAKACGISAKVLLVMLDKEQSLVSDPWPNENQYFLAMGYACPDSGPGNSANCDPSKGGFAKQVYRAAWQFKVYKAFPDSYRYKPFQTATVQWHPNVGCGTSQVKIENYATAGLYIYTPYRPNQAALNAGWGTGDACSTYGNRNFYNYYNAWFGSPTIYLHPALASLAERERAVLGAVTSNPTEVGGGIRQRFAGGEIYWHSETGPVVVRGGMLTGYKQRGDGAGQLGFPTAPEGPTPGGAAQRFQRGELFWRQSTGTLSVRNGIHKHFVENGALPVFGYPLADEAAGEPGTSSQVFQKAGITWGPEVGAQSIRTGMLTAYKERGGLAKVGFARASETSVPGGAWQPFSKADAYWSKARGVKWVVGGIRTTLGRHGGVQAIGFPLAAEYRTADGAVRQDFERASIIWSSGTGGGVLSGPLLAAYDANGVTAFGYPIGSVASVAGGISQEFGRGSVYMANGGKPVIVLGGVRTAFDRNGGVGKLGFPLAAEYRTADGAVRQDFERATVMWSPTGSSISVR